MRPRYAPASLEGDDWDLVFTKHEVLYVCKGPGCPYQSTYWGEAQAHQRETGHVGFSLRRAEAP